ncbi:MAG: short-chain dehydrogenase [Sphingomonas bacterium]|nr:short-chain dehydrogenase [Sphingomonas bacterium]
MIDIEGRTAFVTGGASGIGLGMAKRLLDAGAKVAIADIRQDHLDAAIGVLDNRAAIGLKLDVADRAGFAAAADEAEARLGPVSIVMNNAGVNLFAPIDECSYDDWDWLLGVNLHGVINGCQTFVPRMKARGAGGQIVNTASMAAFLAGPSAGIYTATKFAVRGMTESLRWSLAPHGIGVSCLCPGLVKSAIHESDMVRPESLKGEASEADQEFMARLAQLHQVGMEPDEVAERVIEGIRENRLYIFPHHEFRDELKEVFDEILSAFPEPTDTDPRRLAFEKGRRQTYETARRKAGG